MRTVTRVPRTSTGTHRGVQAAVSGGRPGPCAHAFSLPFRTWVYPPTSHRGDRSSLPSPKALTPEGRAKGRRTQADICMGRWEAVAGYSQGKANIPAAGQGAPTWGDSPAPANAAHGEVRAGPGVRGPAVRSRRRRPGSEGTVPSPKHRMATGRRAAHSGRRAAQVAVGGSYGVGKSRARHGQAKASPTSPCPSFLQGSMPSNSPRGVNSIVVTRSRRRQGRVPGWDLGAFLERFPPHCLPKNLVLHH